jgi:hypothetical protein
VLLSKSELKIVILVVTSTEVPEVAFLRTRK